MAETTSTSWRPRKAPLRKARWLSRATTFRSLRYLCLLPAPAAAERRGAVRDCRRWRRKINGVPSSEHFPKVHRHEVALFLKCRVVTTGYVSSPLRPGRQSAVRRGISTSSERGGSDNPHRQLVS